MSLFSAKGRQDYMFNRAKDQVAQWLQEDGFAKIGKTGTPIPYDEAMKLAYNAKALSSWTPDGSILKAIQSFFEFLINNQSQIEALAKELMELIALFKGI